jgi:hypothetical protein
LDLTRIYMISGGRFHDFDLARLKMLNILAEDDAFRATCASNFNDMGSLDGYQGLALYTCDLMPSPVQTAVLESFVRRGGRILALHAANAPIDFTDGPPVVSSGVRIPGLVKEPTADIAPEFMALLGSRFRAHLASQEFLINVADADHDLTRGLQDFKIVDEPYIAEILGEVRVLLSARYKGDAPGYVLGHWADDPPRPQLYVKTHGAGAVAYMTLGHCCGKYDLRPMVENAPAVRGPWDDATYLEIVRRGLRWLGG